MTDTAQEQEGVEDAIRHLKDVSSTLDDKTFKAINAVVRENRRLRARQREEGDDLERVLRGQIGTGRKDGPLSQWTAENAGYDYLSFEAGVEAAVERVREILRDNRRGR